MEQTEQPASYSTHPIPLIWPFVWCTWLFACDNVVINSWRYFIFTDVFMISLFNLFPIIYSQQQQHLKKSPSKGVRVRFVSSSCSLFPIFVCCIFLNTKSRPRWGSSRTWRRSIRDSAAWFSVFSSRDIRGRYKKIGQHKTQDNEETVRVFNASEWSRWNGCNGWFLPMFMARLSTLIHCATI